MSNSDTVGKLHSTYDDIGDYDGYCRCRIGRNHHSSETIIDPTPPTQSESGLEDSIEHCINSLIGIVKHTESFNHDPEKKARQLERNRSSTAEAKITLKALVAQRERAAVQRIYDAIKDMERAYDNGAGRTLSKGEIIKWLEFELGIGTGRNG